MQGIYKIENIKNGKIYVGQSKDVQKRWKQHLYELKNGTHHSSKLQHSYNKTKNKDVFQFNVIEEVEDEAELNAREQYWIDFYDAFNKGYNCSARVDDPRYVLKNVKRLIKEKELNELYAIFDSLYKDSKIKIVYKTFEDRLTHHHYKKPLIIVDMIEILSDEYGYLQDIMDLGYTIQAGWDKLLNAVAIYIRDKNDVRWMRLPWTDIKQMEFRPLKRFKYYYKYFSEETYEHWEDYESWLEPDYKYSRTPTTWMTKANQEFEKSENSK